MQVRMKEFVKQFPQSEGSLDCLKNTIINNVTQVPQKREGKKEIDPSISPQFCMDFEFAIMAVVLVVLVVLNI